MLRSGIKEFEIPKVQQQLAEGRSPAEIAEEMMCPVECIESFFEVADHSKPKEKPAEE